TTTRSASADLGRSSQPRRSAPSRMPGGNGPAAPLRPRRPRPFVGSTLRGLGRRDGQGLAEGEGERKGEEYHAADHREGHPDTGRVAEEAVEEGRERGGPDAEGVEDRVAARATV